MKIAFSILILLHGFIHLIGVVKAVNPGAIPQLNRNISKTEGVIWLLTTLLLLLAFLLLILKKDWWPTIAVTGVILSQFLISLNWEDARWGTIPNLLILAVAMSALGSSRFEKRVIKETSSILETHQPQSGITEINSLPPIIQKWLKKSGAIDHEVIYNVRLEQEGKMRTTPKGKWMSFSAVQFFNVQEPGFVWKTRVAAYPGVFLYGRDKLQHAKGEMLIKLLALINVVNEKDNIQVDTGSLLRFLGEICWFPSAALQPYIQWENISSTSAKAFLKQKETTVEGVFHFSPQGKLLSFEAIRYYGAGKKSQKEKWLIEIEDHKDFNGILVPSKCKVTWKLKEDDFHWLSLEVTSLKYNVPV